MRYALNDLATVAPDGLQRQITPDWFDRYRHRLEDYRLPSTQAERQQYCTGVRYQVGDELPGFAPPVTAHVEIPLPSTPDRAHFVAQYVQKVWID